MINTSRKNRIKTDKSIASIVFKYVCLAVLVAYALSIIITFFISISTSLKTAQGYDLDLLGLPFGKYFSIQNYIDVLTVIKIPVMMGNTTRNVTVIGMAVNSIVFSVGGALLSTVFCCITAYAVAKFDNFLSKIIYGIVIVCMALPIVGSLPSELQVLISLNLYNKRLGLVLLAGTFLGMHFLIFHASFKSIPKDFAEAAKIDGASEMRILLTIMLPLVKLVFFTIFLLKFMVLWNNYETPLIHTPSYPVLAYGVFKVYKGDGVVTGSGLRATTMPHKLAASMLVLIPMLIIFLFTHKRLIGNVSMGGVKG